MAKASSACAGRVCYLIWGPQALSSLVNFFLSARFSVCYPFSPRFPLYELKRKPDSENEDPQQAP